MNRTLSCSLVIGLLLAAIAICIKQTLDLSGQIANSSLALILSGEGVIVGALIASAVTLFRRRFARQKKPATRRPIGEVARV